MGMPIIPRIERGRLYFQTTDVSFPTFAQAATARAAAEAHRLDIINQPAQDAPRRRCDECALNLGRDVSALSVPARAGASRVTVLNAAARHSSPRNGAR
jgi:hypothetical protein